MYCQKCGAELHGNYCAICGKTYNTTPPASPPHTGQTATGPVPSYQQPQPQNGTYTQAPHSQPPHSPYQQNSQPQGGSSATTYQQNPFEPVHAPAYHGAPAPMPTYVSPKSRLAMLLLAIFLGYLGVHRFYAGKVGTGLLYLFSYGAFGIGWIVDIILIATGSFRDAHGYLITTW